MSRPGASRAYGAAVVALVGVVALWRCDLVLGAWRQTLWTFAQGGSARWQLLGEVVLLAAILAATALTVPLRPRPAHDATVLLLAATAGWAAEAWGTRLGLWRYYTGEQPPLWIVPVWPLGAALIDRVAERARAAWGPAPAHWYWALAAAAGGYCAWFSLPWASRPEAWAVMALLAAGLAAGARPRDDFWTLAAGIACVFFADLWGTTNGCWSYYVRGRPLGLWQGIGFGMTFDAAAVAACLNLTRAMRL